MQAVVKWLHQWWTGDSGDRIEVLNALLKNVQQNEKEGNPESVLNAIDKYAKGTPLPKHLDDEQCRILDDIVKNNADSVVGLELGAYCGYSAIRIASNSANSNSKLISFEKDQFNKGIAQRMIEHAGLSSKVQLFKGTLKEGAGDLQKFIKDMGAPCFNFVFMNHSRKFYLEDFKFLKEIRVLGKKTVIVANTKGFPKKQDYLNYVKEHPNEFEFQTTANESDVNAPSMTVATYKL